MLITSYQSVQYINSFIHAKALTEHNSIAIDFGIIWMSFVKTYQYLFRYVGDPGFSGWAIDDIKIHENLGSFCFKISSYRYTVVRSYWIIKVIDNIILDTVLI